MYFHRMNQRINLTMGGLLGLIDRIENGDQPRIPLSHAS